MKKWLRKWLGIHNIQDQIDSVERTTDSLRQSVRDIRFGPESGVHYGPAFIKNGEAIRAITSHLKINLEYTTPVQSKVVVIPEAVPRDYNLMDVPK